MAKRRRRDRPSVQARKALPPAEPSMKTWLGWFHEEACAELEARQRALAARFLGADGR